MPEFISNPEITIFRINIDINNPLHPQEYIKIEAYSKESKKNVIPQTEKQMST